MTAKKLYLIRHGKAEDHSFFKRDYDRELVNKGRERSRQIASILSQQIDKTATLAILSSSASRAIQTAEVFSQTIDFPTDKIIQTKKIYEAHYLDILHSINEYSPSVDTLLVFGHNPGLSDLTYYLTNTFVDLKTSHVAVIELERGIDYDNLSGGTASLKAVMS